MFGGLAAYLEGRLVMVLTESPGERLWKGVDYGFDLWNGVLLPTERSEHAALREAYPDLRSHPVLGKWLFLPLMADNFEDTLQALSAAIAAGDPRLGIVPPPKKAKTRSYRFGERID